MILRAGFCLFALALPAVAQSYATRTYLCDRGVEVPATYVVGP